ncbi:MAG TPA: hypothetical protein VMV31_07310 [Terriglobales bacterium]|nr:hypothetical protein [Terriglobales bacterium]
MELRRRGAAALGLVWAGVLGLAQQPVAPANPPLSALAVVQKMVAMNAARAAALHGYSGCRIYRVVYSGLLHASAEMRVEADYRAPGPARLTVVSESGSGLLLRRVLEPLLRVEQGESTQGRRQDIAIVPEKYIFKMLKLPGGPTQPDYVIEATPRDSKHSWFRGTLWINSAEYAVERMEGRLTHSPSWWVTRTQVQYRTRKIGEFWLPASHHAASGVRFWGHAELDISYPHYALLSATPVEPVAAGGGR